MAIKEIENPRNLGMLNKLKIWDKLKCIKSFNHAMLGVELSMSVGDLFVVSTDASGLYIPITCRIADHVGCEVFYREVIAKLIPNEKVFDYLELVEA